MIQQLYHVGQHGDADNSFAPNWSPSGLPSYHDADGSHAMTEAEIEEVIDGLRRGGAAGRRRAGFDGIEIFAAYHALVDQFWTPWSNRRTDDVGRLVRGPDALLVRRSCGGSASACGDDFIIGLAVSVDPESPRRCCRSTELAEIVAWHDERRLMDYVTCGTGSYFDFYQIIPPSLYEQRLGEPFAAALKARRAARRRPGREPHPDARRGRGGPRRRPCRHGQHRPRPDRRPAPGRQGPRRPRRRGPAVHLVQPAVLGPPVARLLDLVPRQPVGRARVRSGAATGSSRRPVRGACWSSAAGRPGWRRRGSRRSAAIA